jgi:hypothetical protein
MTTTMIAKLVVFMAGAFVTMVGLGAALVGNSVDTQGFTFRSKTAFTDRRPSDNGRRWHRHACLEPMIGPLALAVLFAAICTGAGVIAFFITLAHIGKPVWSCARINGSWWLRSFWRSSGL